MWLSIVVLTLSGAALSSSIWSPEVSKMTVSERSFLALLDTSVAAVCSPCIYWLSLRILTAPVLIAAAIRHEEEAGNSVQDFDESAVVNKEPVDATPSHDGGKSNAA